MRISILATLALVAAFTGCANQGYYQPSSTSADSASGITVFGEVDASVTRTR